MIALPHPFTATESRDIEVALRTYHYKISARSKKDWYQHVDVSRVLTSILSGEKPSAIVDGYLVVYDIGSTWYSDKLMLEEVMVLCVYPGGDFKNVPRYLEAKARECGCAFVAVGTALARTDAALVAMYESAGYQTAAVQLTKTL